MQYIKIVSFVGRVPHGLHAHPDKEHLIYLLGSTVVIENINTRKQSFLHGQKDNFCCLAVSRDGRYLAAGQNTHMGFKVRKRFSVN